MSRPRARLAFQLVGLAGPLALAGCHHSQPSPEPPPPATVTSGSTLEVVAPFVIPRSAPGVYFQDASVRAQPDLRREATYCFFQLGPAAEAARTIGPQAFTVTGIEYDERAEGAAGGFGSITHYNLESGPQPGPQRLTCMLPGAAGAPRFVTPVEVMEAVGGYLKLTVAP